MASGVDGRVRRGQLTREAILDAYVALMREGSLRPPAAAIAERAGIPLRTLWAHFKNTENLLVQAVDRWISDDDQHRGSVDPDLPLDERVARFCAERVRRMTNIGPAAAAAALADLDAPAVHAQRRAYLLGARDEAAEVFAAEIRAADDPEALTDALAVATSYSAWHFLVTDCERAPAAAARTMELSVRALLGA